MATLGSSEIHSIICSMLRLTTSNTNTLKFYHLLLLRLLLRKRIVLQNIPHNINLSDYSPLILPWRYNEKCCHPVYMHGLAAFCEFMLFGLGYIFILFLLVFEYYLQVLNQALPVAFAHKPYNVLWPGPSCWFAGTK